MMKTILRISALVLTSLASTHSLALTIGFSESNNPPWVFLQVGTGTYNADNSTVNVVSGHVPGSKNGNSIPLVMSSNSAVAGPYYPNGISCTSPNQLYLAAKIRRLTGSGTLTVTAPAYLNSNSNDIPIDKITWETDGSVGIPSRGALKPGTQTLLSLESNQGYENCLTFSYANDIIAPSGKFRARVVYSLVSP